MDVYNTSGSVEVICGCMFSGKSEELIRRLKRCQYANQKIKIFNHCIDKRYGDEEIKSHNQTGMPSIMISEITQIFDYLKGDEDVVAIDEIQFFNGDVSYVLSELASKGIRVIVAGLDKDFKNKPFNDMPNILATADFVTKLHAICVKCGALASCTQRIINGKPAKKDDPLIVVDGAEQYEARCRKCHQIGE